MDPNSSAFGLLLIVLILLIVIFFIPTIYAFCIRHPHRWWILLFNFIVGGSGIGWLAAMFWSFGKLFPRSRKQSTF